MVPLAQLDVADRLTVRIDSRLMVNQHFLIIAQKYRSPKIMAQGPFTPNDDERESDMCNVLIQFIDFMCIVDP